MSDKGGIQLLPDARRKIEVRVPGENRLFYIGIGFLIMVAVLFGALKSVTHALEKKVKDKNAAIVAMNQSRDHRMEQQLVALSKQTALISTFLDSHVFWTKALEQIQKALHQQVQFSVLNASFQTKEIRFTAQAPDYTTIARQLAAFVADDGVEDVQISGAKAINNGRYEFVVKIFFDETKYLRK